MGSMNGGHIDMRLPLHVASVGFGCRGHVLPKHGGKVTLVGEADLMADLDDRPLGLPQELLGALDPAHDHVVVGRLTGRLSEQTSKVVGTRLRHGRNLDQG